LEGEGLSPRLSATPDRRENPGWANQNLIVN
jgi:hypothetical protein